MAFGGDNYVMVHCQCSIKAYLHAQRPIFISMGSADAVTIWYQSVKNPDAMMTSSNGNIFRVTGLLCVEFTGDRWISLAKASDAELWYFPWSAPWINSWVNNREAGDLTSLWCTIHVRKNERLPPDKYLLIYSSSLCLQGIVLYQGIYQGVTWGQSRYWGQLNLIWTKPFFVFIGSASYKSYKRAQPLYIYIYVYIYIW